MSEDLLKKMKMWDKDAWLSLLDSSPFMVLFKDKESKWIWMNRAFLEGMGYPSRGYVTGKSTSELLQNGEQFRNEDLHVARTGEPLLGLLREVILHNGERKWHYTDKIPIKSPMGEIEGVVSFIRDISEEINTHKKLERLNKLLKAIRYVNQLILKEEISPCHLLEETCDALENSQCYKDLWIVFYESKYEHLLLFSSSESKEELEYIMDRSHFFKLVERIPQKKVLILDCNDRIFNKWKLSEKNSDLSLLAARIEHNDKLYGIICALLPKNISIDDEEKGLLLEVAGDLGYAINVLEVKDGFRKGEVLMERLFDVSPEGIILVAPDGHILRANGAFCHLFGYSNPQEIINKNIDELVADEDQRDEAVKLTRAVVNGEKISVEGARRRSDGTLIDVSIMGVPIEFNGSLKYCPL